jgi:hypothetical protein
MVVVVTADEVDIFADGVSSDEEVKAAFTSIL